MRSEAEATFGRTGVPEAGADARLRGLFAAIDGGSMEATARPAGALVRRERRPAPVTVGQGGELVGELALADGVVFLAEQNPADVDRRGWTILQAVRVSIGMLLLGCGLESCGGEWSVLVWPTVLCYALAFPIGAALGQRRTSVLSDAPLASTCAGTPGVFLLADALVVRRAATCDVFPRQSITAIAGVERVRDGAVRYQVTQITYQGLRGRCTYTLDVGPPIGAWHTPEVLTDEQVRVARLRRLQAWLNG